MSVEELKVLHKKAQNIIDSKLDSAIAEIYAQVKVLADSIGMSVEELTAWGKVHAGKRKVAPRYRDIEDFNKTWTGRGMKPKWLVDRLEQGHDIEEFLIKDQEA